MPGRANGSAPVPKAAVLALLLPLSLTLASWLALRLQASFDRKTLIFIGDSFTGNYRFAAPQRLQDVTEGLLGNPWQVFNFGRPGAFPLDVLLQVHQAQTLVGHVDAVVMPLFVSKFRVGTGSYARLDERGDNLKWLRLGEASAVTATFDRELWKKTAIHKVGLLFGFYDLIAYAFTEAWKSPAERAQMQANPPARQAGIRQKVAEHAKWWDEGPLTSATFEASPAARDLDLLVQHAKTQRIQLLFVLLPDGDPDVIDEVFTPQAKANLAEAQRRTVAWCESRHVAWIDVTPRLHGHLYDDFNHLKDVRGNAAIARAVAAWARPGP